jgi:hypothetical protein
VAIKLSDFSDKTFVLILLVQIVKTQCLLKCLNSRRCGQALHRIGNVFCQTVSRHTSEHVQNHSVGAFLHPGLQWIDSQASTTLWSLEKKLRVVPTGPVNAKIPTFLFNNPGV